MARFAALILILGTLTGKAAGQEWDEGMTPLDAFSHAMGRAREPVDDEELALWIQRMRASARALAEDGTRENAAYDAQVYLCFADAFEARMLRDRGDLEDARRVLASGREALIGLEAEDAPSTTRTMVEMELANVLLDLGELGQAETLAEGIEARLGAQPDYRRPCYKLQIDLALKAGTPDRALVPLERLRELAEGPEASAKHRINWMLRRARFLQADKQFEQAAAELDAFLEREVELEPTRTQSLRTLLGQALARLEHDDPARPERAATILEPLAEFEDKDGLGAQIWLIRLALARRDPVTAELWLEFARPLADSLHESWDLAAKVAALDVRQAIQAGLAPSVIEARARTLNGAVERFVDRWSEQTARAGGRSVLQFGTRLLMFAAQAEAALALSPGAEGRFTAATFAAEALGHGQLAAKLGLARDDAASDLAFAQRELVPPGGGLLIFLPAPTHSHLFVLDAAGTEHYPLPGREALGRLREALIEALQFDHARHDARSEEVVRRAGRELADALLPDGLRPRLASWGGLAVVGEETLGSIPFGALVTEETWLGERLPITYPLSLRVGRALVERSGQSAQESAPDPEPKRGPRRTDATDLVLFAAPRIDDDPTLAPLEWSAALEEQTAGPLSRVVHAGPEATRARLMDIPLRDFAVLQVLAHGDYDRRDPRPARLRLTPSGTDDGAVTCADLEGLALPPLVVLTACGSARAPERRGEDGDTHLGGAGLAGGAQAVLLSKLELPYAATRELCGRFYAELEQDPRPSVALWKAARAMPDAPPSARFGLFVAGLGFDTVPLSSPERASASHAGSRLALGLVGIVIVAGFATRIAGRRRQRAQPPPARPGG